MFSPNPNPISDSNLELTTNQPNTTTEVTASAYKQLEVLSPQTTSMSPTEKAKDDDLTIREKICELAEKRQALSFQRLGLVNQKMNLTDQRQDLKAKKLDLREQMNQILKQENDIQAEMNGIFKGDNALQEEEIKMGLRLKNGGE